MHEKRAVHAKALQNSQRLQSSLDQTEAKQQVIQANEDMESERQQVMRPNAEISINMNQLLMDTLNNQFNYGQVIGQSEQREEMSEKGQSNPANLSTNLYKPRHLSAAEQRPQQWLDQHQVKGIYQH